MDSYYGAHFDRDQQGRDARADIRSTLDEWRQSPMLGLQFLAEKNASQWNNPDFSAFLITQRHGTPLDHSPIAARFLSLEGADKFMGYLNRLQWVILGGVLLSCFFVRDRVSAYCQLAVLGGFVFHLFWEGKSQYTLPYFVLLLPLAVSGYHAWYTRWSVPATRMRTALTTTGLVVDLAIVFALVGSTKFALLNNMFYFTHHGDDYREFLARYTYTQVPEGRYYLVPAATSEAQLSWALPGGIVMPEPILSVDATSSGQWDFYFSRANQALLLHADTPASVAHGDPLWADMYLEGLVTHRSPEATHSVTLSLHYDDRRPARWWERLFLSTTER